MEFLTPTANHDRGRPSQPYINSSWPLLSNLYTTGDVELLEALAYSEAQPPGPLHSSAAISFRTPGFSAPVPPPQPRESLAESSFTSVNVTRSASQSPSPPTPWTVHDPETHSLSAGFLATSPDPRGHADRALSPTASHDASPHSGPLPTLPPPLHYALRWPDDRIAKARAHPATSPALDVNPPSPVPALLTKSIYTWQLAVLDPRNRTDKRIPTPRGLCLLCSVKSPPIFDQCGKLKKHVANVHRFRLAALVRAEKPVNLAYGFAYVAVELQKQNGRSYHHAELSRFQELVAAFPGGVPTELVAPEEFPYLYQLLGQFSMNQWLHPEGGRKTSSGKV
ncbi:hypothetical protein DL93DRAFT_2070563 [Clavulina sp. PMI_390]|nr:hypothetical protein DL93DRAFT_2070563 [Clavulina sp. PMI_390]